MEEGETIDRRTPPPSSNPERPHDARREGLSANPAPGSLLVECRAARVSSYPRPTRAPSQARTGPRGPLAAHATPFGDS